MTFNQIILKNFKNNIRYYGMYIFSLITSIVLFFSFVTLKYTESINNEDSSTIIKKGAEIGANFLFVIIIIFLMYANYLFIKRRTKEFAMYQLIGLTKYHLLRILFLEQSVMFISTGLVGIFIGVFGSKILLMIVLKMLGISIGVSIGFQYMAVIQTAIMLFIAFVLILVQSYIFIKKRSILSLMDDKAKADTTHKKITVLEVIAGAFGIIMIATGYYLSTEMFSKFITQVGILIPGILILTIGGAYLFFRSSVSVIFKSLKRFKRGHVSITDVVFTASIMHRMKKNALSLTIIATISAVTVTVLCFSAINKAQGDDMVDMQSPQDIVYNDQQSAKKLEKQLNQHNIDYNIAYKEVAYVPIKKQDVFNIGSQNVKTSNVVITSDKYFKGIEAHGHKGQVIMPKSAQGNYDFKLGQDIVFKGDRDVAIKFNTEKTINAFQSTVSFNQPVFLLSDNLYQSLKSSAEETNKQYGFTIKNHDDMTQATDLSQSIEPKIETRDAIQDRVHQSIGILLFMTSFLGLAFLVASGCIIYIKQMDETEDEIENYRILCKMGYTHRDMLRGLSLKVMVNFGLPLIVSLGHAFFAATAFNQIMGTQQMLPIYIVMIAYSIVYCIFGIMSFIHSSRTVKHAI
ncbi:ABC transporter permease [Staphylococcus arlettae]